MSRTRYRISDVEWEEIMPVLPKHVSTHRFRRGRSRADDHKDTSLCD